MLLSTFRKNLLSGPRYRLEMLFIMAFVLFPFDELLFLVIFPMAL